MPIDSRQYDSAMDFTFDEVKFQKLLGNVVSNDDKIRLKAYLIYEDMYHNRPENIRITLRGDDEDSIQIYMPSAKKCIEAVNRFLAVGWNITQDPGTNPDQETSVLVAAVLDKLFKRERMKAKFAQLKRYMLIKGDALLHVRADPRKPPGRRICIDELKPEHYFPIENADGEIIGCHIVDVIKNPKSTLRLKYHRGNEIVKRQTYRQELDETGLPTGRITSQLGLYAIGKWDDRVLPAADIELIERIRDEYYLPKEIQHIPVYHWRNTPPPGSTFGMSELAGVESIVNAINQSMSDEDLTLIMQGLGVYWTDASPPLNAAGEQVEWEISPRSVVQVASGGQFGRVSGITTVQPFGDHIRALDEAIQQALGLSDVAMGLVNDTSVAESGVALALKLSPLLAKNKEKELDILDTSDQFIYDLINGWIKAYERISVDGVNYVNIFDDAMPKNKSKDLADLLTIWVQAANTMPVGWFYQQLNLIMGYNLDPENDFDQALSDAIRIAEAAAGPQPAPVDPNAQGGDMVGAGAPSTNGSGG
jgi:hypothetical protein